MPESVQSKTTPQGVYGGNHPAAPGVACPFCGKDTLVASWVQKTKAAPLFLTMHRQGKSSMKVAEAPTRMTFTWFIRVICSSCGATGDAA